jgi:hypothetical protein
VTWKSLSSISSEEKILWFCVLRRAVFDYVLYRGSGKHKLRWKKAASFIFGARPDEAEGLSFEDICALLTWEPDYVRRLVRSLNKSDIGRIETTKLRELMDTKPPIESKKLCQIPEERIFLGSYEALFGASVSSRVQLRRKSPESLV